MQISYAEVNAVLFDAMKFVADRDEQISEVELSIIRILEALKSKKFICWEEALRVQKETGLEHYLEQHNPNFGHEQLTHLNFNDRAHRKK
jgi:hypothetical protein